MILNLGEGNIYAENLDYINSGAVIKYNFNTRIYRPDETLPAVICAEAYPLPFEGIYDSNTKDNFDCIISSENLKVFNPAPNPAQTFINVEFISLYKSDIKLVVRNSMEKTVYEK